jgi:hypothetical protein
MHHEAALLPRYALRKQREDPVTTVRKHYAACLLLCTLGIALNADTGFAQSNSDFDFEIGTWKAHLSRLQNPLTGSTTWTEYEGTSVVRKVWDGRANLGEIDISGPSGHIEGLSLRLYNPQSRQWNIHWASSRDGALGAAMVGEFKNGRGEFFNQEMFDGRAIFVRFIFSDITATSFRLEQAFSADGGKTWEANWIAKFTR